MYVITTYLLELNVHSLSTFGTSSPNPSSPVSINIPENILVAFAYSNGILVKRPCARCIESAESRKQIRIP